jgi:hypothetical protein
VRAALCASIEHPESGAAFVQSQNYIRSIKFYDNSIFSTRVFMAILITLELFHLHLTLIFAHAACVRSAQKAAAYIISKGPSDLTGRFKANIQYRWQMPISRVFKHQ